MNEYISNSEEELLQFVANSLSLDAESIENKDTFQKRIASQKINKLKTMKLHGQFEVETEEKKTEESWHWLSKGDLKRETEALLMAA